MVPIPYCNGLVTLIFVENRLLLTILSEMPTLKADPRKVHFVIITFIIHLGLQHASMSQLLIFTVNPTLASTGMHGRKL